MAWAAVHPTGVPAVNRTNGSDTIAQIVANAEAGQFNCGLESTRVLTGGRWHRLFEI